MKKALLSFLVITLFLQAEAQVRDISVTLAPKATFTWWNDKAGLDNSLGVGANLGFGFGEYVELKATYLQSHEMTTSFQDYGLPNFNENLFQAQNVSMKRWGTEMRTNLGTKALAPFILFGSGIQTLEVENNDPTNQIFTELGAGLKLNFGHRTAFTVEARNTSYKFNAVENLLTDANKADFGINDADYMAERIGNWSFSTSLQFYLGGTKPEDMTELDRAYRAYYQHGFSGARWVFEPAVSHIKFDDASMFRNTYLIGLYTGMDFNEYVGVRGFYFRATNNNEIDFSQTLFDDLSLYGVEFRAKFNSSVGVTPYLTLGGGYIDPMEGYVPVSGTEIEGDLFASAGAGLLVPLGKKVEVFANGNFLLTSGADKTTAANSIANDILTHKMVNVGVKFSIGKTAESPGETFQREKTRIIEAEQSTYEQKLSEMKLAYLEQISELETELEQARADGDSIRAAYIEADKKKAENMYSKLEPGYARDTTAQSGEIIMRMTPEQFEKLIKTVMEGVKEMKPEVEKIKEDSTVTSQQIKLLEQMNLKMQNLEENLNDLNQSQDSLVARKAAPTSASLTSAEVQKQPEVNEEVLEKLDKLQQDYSQLSQDISFLKGQNANEGAQQPIVVNSGQQEQEEPMVVTQTVKEDGTTEVSAQKVSDLEEGTFDFRGVSPMLGFNFGGAFTFNMGVRAHMPIQKTSLELAPELFFGLGKKSSFGIVGNVIYPFELEDSKFQPYGGGGIGIWKIDGKSNLGLNLVGGTYLDVLDGKLFADVSLRALKHVQLSVGYTFEF